MCMLLRNGSNIRFYRRRGWRSCKRLKGLATTMRSLSSFVTELSWAKVTWWVLIWLGWTWFASSTGKHKYHELTCEELSHIMLYLYEECWNSFKLWSLLFSFSYVIRLSTSNTHVVELFHLLILSKSMIDYHIYMLLNIDWLLWNSCCRWKLYFYPLFETTLDVSLTENRRVGWNLFLSIFLGFRYKYIL